MRASRPGGGALVLACAATVVAFAGAADGRSASQPRIAAPREAAASALPSEGIASPQASAAAPAFVLGRAPSAATLAAERVAIAPDGTGLPAGRGSVAEGARVYETRCANCHDTPAFPQLWGGVGSLTRLPEKTVGSYWPYATTLYDYISRAMPPAAGRPLSANDVYAVSAYVLSRSDIVPANAVLDRETLPRVKMPNRDGFFPNDGKPDP